MAESQGLIAVDQLLAAAAAGKVTPEKVASPAKHKNLTAMQVPDTLVRYAPRVANLAKAMGTDKTTRLIRIGSTW